MKIRVLNQFKKDYKKVVKQGKSNDKITFVISELFNKRKLESKYEDH